MIIVDIGESNGLIAKPAIMDLKHRIDDENISVRL